MFRPLVVEELARGYWNSLVNLTICNNITKKVEGWNEEFKDEGCKQVAKIRG